MGIRKEINDVIVARGGKPPVNGGIAASIDALSKLPPSWNDLTDKPFYEEGIPFEVNATITATADQGGVVLDVFTFEVKKGAIYKVVIDGVNYEVTGREYEPGMNFIGDIGLLTGNGATEGEPPFAYGRGAFVMKNDGTFEVSISGEQAVVHTLDRKYIPLMGDGEIHLGEDFTYTLSEGLRCDTSIVGKTVYLYGKPHRISDFYGDDSEGSFVIYDISGQLKDEDYRLILKAYRFYSDGTYILTNKRFIPDN